MYTQQGEQEEGKRNSCVVLGTNTVARKSRKNPTTNWEFLGKATIWGKMVLAEGYLGVWRFIWPTGSSPRPLKRPHSHENHKKSPHRSKKKIFSFTIFSTVFLWFTLGLLVTARQHWNGPGRIVGRTRLLGCCTRNFTDYFHSKLRMEPRGKFSKNFFSEIFFSLFLYFFTNYVHTQTQVRRREREKRNFVGFGCVCVTVWKMLWVAG